MAIEFFEHIENDWVLTPVDKGGFGLVYKGENKNSSNNKLPNIVCVKRIKKNEFGLNEAEILKRLSDHDGEKSIEFYGCGKDEEFKYIYMEYIFDKSLSFTINEKKKSNSSFTEEEIIELAIKIVSTLAYIHQNNIIHRDVKSEHIFIIRDDEGKVKSIKLIDFGFSKEFSDDVGSSNYSFLGTDRYMAPEVRLQNGKASRKSDVYSLGCVLIEMTGGELRKSDGLSQKEFNEEGNPIIPKVSALLMNYGKDGNPIIPEHVSYRLRNIIQQCVQQNIDARLDSESLYNRLLKIINPDEAVENTTKKKVDKHLVVKELSKISISSEVTCLSLSSFNQEIHLDSIPESVKYLDLGDEFDLQLNGDNIPTESILTLRCGFNFTKVLNQKSIPQSVTNLQLHNYNLPLVRNSIPKSVVYLTLGSNFTDFQSLNQLPLSVIELTLGINDEYNISEIIKSVNPNISSLKINNKERRL